MAFDAIIKLQACDAVIESNVYIAMLDTFVIDPHRQLGINDIASKPSSYKGIPKVLGAPSSFWAVVWTKRRPSTSSGWGVSKSALP